VGIGTVNPQSKLTVTGDGTGYANIGGGFCGGNYTGINLNGQAPNGLCTNYNILSSPSDQNFYLNRPSGFSMNFREANADQMVILTGGNIGMGTSAPTQKLHVVGNIRFSGALMPNNLSGTTGNVLVSQGANTAPVWSPFILTNMPATTEIGKYYSSMSWVGTWANNTALTFTISDASCTTSSEISVSIDGPWNALYAGIQIRSIVAENGQWRITAVNNTGGGLTGGIPIAFVAFY
jgi:hypothetical protein